MSVALEAIDMDRFVAASVIKDGKLFASGKAMVKGRVGEFVPNDQEELMLPVESAILKIAGYPPLQIFDITQRLEVSGWRFKIN